MGVGNTKLGSRRRGEVDGSLRQMRMGALWLDTTGVEVSQTIGLMLVDDTGGSVEASGPQLILAKMMSELSWG